MRTPPSDISVAIAVLNGIPYLKEQLDSILANLTDGDEIIISDDGSTDGSKELIETYCASHPQVKYVSGPGKGIKQNFANAIQHCQNDIIFLSDQDDVWKKNKVEVILPLFDDPDCMVVTHNAEFIDEHGERLPDSTFAWRSSRSGILHNIWKNSYMGCCMAFRKELVSDILPIPDTIEMHDQWIGILGEARGKSVFLDQKLIQYRRHDQNAFELHHHSLSVMLANRLHLIREFLHRRHSLKQTEFTGEKINSHLTKGDFLLCFLVFVIFLAGAFLLPMDQCPDEGGRQALTEFLLKYHKLPFGDEPEILLGGWGFSYALRPYLSSLISAFFGTMMSLFTNSPIFLRPAFRFGSVLSAVMTAVFSLKTGKLLFRHHTTVWLYTSIIVFLPQVLFLGMYLNNDSLSLAAVSAIIYYYVQGLRSHWNPGCCIGLGFAFSIALLSYYTVYGWILLAGIFFLVTLFKDNTLDQSAMLKRLAIVSGICFLLAVPFFIRNALIHQGDVFGIATEETIRSNLAKQGYTLFQYNRFSEKGYSLIGFLSYEHNHFVKMTVMSFFGVFGYLNILMPPRLYHCYYLFFLIGILLFLFMKISPHSKERYRSLFWLMLGSSIIIIILHVYQSYARDYQPQGRYIITIILLLAYMVGYGMEYLEDEMLKTKVLMIPTYLMNGIYMLLAGWAIFGTMVKMLS